MEGQWVNKRWGDAEYYFELEYDGWVDDCKDIVYKAKIIFDELMKR